jgi:hypothetical protein
MRWVMPLFFIESPAKAVHTFMTPHNTSERAADPIAGG